MLVPDDEDVGSPSTFQFFDFVESTVGDFFVPVFADARLLPNEVSIAFFNRGAENGLWGRRSLRKEAIVCVDTESGVCHGDDCEAGCAKITWGDPGSPRWVCDCPS